jgi:hypothetical protein
MNIFQSLGIYLYNKLPYTRSIKLFFLYENYEVL